MHHVPPGAVPPVLAEVAGPLVEQIARLNVQIAAMDQQIEKLAARYPAIGTLRSAPDVGALVAAAYGSFVMRTSWDKSPGLLPRKDLPQQRMPRPLCYGSTGTRREPWYALI